VPRDDRALAYINIKARKPRPTKTYESNRRVICPRADLDVWQYFNTPHAQSQAKFGSRIMHIRARAREKGTGGERRQASQNIHFSALFLHARLCRCAEGKYDLPKELWKRRFFLPALKNSSLFVLPVFSFFKK